MKLLLSTVLCFTSVLMFSQDTTLNKNPNKERKLSIGISGGNYTQMLERNGEHFDNLNSYNANISLDYMISETSYLKVKYEGISTISFSGISYDSYKIPLLIGNNLYSGKTYNSDINLQGEIGPYVRTISNFKNNSAVRYSDNSVFGIQFSLNLKYNLSSRLFALLSLNINRDFDDILTSQENNIRIEGSYALRFGFGYKF